MRMLASLLVRLEKLDGSGYFAFFIHQIFNPKELKQERIHILTSAALLQVTNPMCIVFLLSLFPQFIDPKGSYVQQVSLMIAMFVITCWFVHIAYSYSAAAAADRWMTKSFSFWLNKISAFLFWLISVSILVKMF